MEADIRRFIREEIRRQVNIILSGSTSDTTEATETIDNLFPGMPSIPTRPVMHPYGYASRASKGTISVVGRQGEHVGNRLVLGHRDKNRPTDLSEGEVVVYSFGTYKLYFRNDRVSVGKGDEVETVVVGETLVEVLSSILDAIIVHTHAAPGAPPTNAASFSSIKTVDVESGSFLAKDGGRF